MLVVSESYQNYKNVAVSNQQTDVRRIGCVLGCMGSHLLRGHKDTQ
jgi:hypothetical protein